MALGSLKTARKALRNSLKVAYITVPVMEFILGTYQSAASPRQKKIIKIIQFLSFINKVGLTVKERVNCILNLLNLVRLPLNFLGW